MIKISTQLWRTTCAGLLVLGLGLVCSSTSGASSQSSHATACASTASPHHLVIFGLCVNAPLDTVRAQGGSVVIPANVHHVGWYNASAAVSGSVGSVVIVGHVNYYGQGPGAFSVLGRAKAGMSVGAREGGATTWWRVTAVRTYPKGHLAWSYFNPKGPRQLVLITCGGKLVHSNDGWHYDKNVVVVAVPRR